MRVRRVDRKTTAFIAEVFKKLDYKTLGDIYCYEGGKEFWRAKRKPCQRLGMKVAKALADRLPPGGRSLYIGAGVAELPPLLVEALACQRQVEPYNLRQSEVTALNRACGSLPVRYCGRDARMAKGTFDHVWMVSVLNDPERFSHLAPLSYGRADPVTFDPAKFQRERRVVQSIVDRCLPMLRLPGLVTTTTEEVIWIADWCHRSNIPYRVERKHYPTALVGDPICFIRVGAKRKKRSTRLSGSQS